MFHVKNLYLNQIICFKIRYKAKSYQGKVSLYSTQNEMPRVERISTTPENHVEIVPIEGGIFGIWPFKCERKTHYVVALERI